MRERRRILELFQRGDVAVLATLVAVEGSSYRRPGARLLVAGNGEYAGAISGGCLEAEILRKAQWLTRDGACVQRYSTLFDDTAEIPYGLGCGGTVHVLLEPANTPEALAVFAAFEATLRGHPRRIMTQLPGPGLPLQRTVLGVNGEVLFGSGKVFDFAAGSFSEQLEPSQRLVVFGAGDDAEPLTRFAALLGWRVIVVDGRPQWARGERFACAEQVLCRDSAQGFEVFADDAVVMMTHSYEQDRGWLRSILPAEPRYLGLLGARHRSALLLQEAAEATGLPLATVCERVFAPVGLDLGGDGAEAIALAIVAEIQACLQHKLPDSRRMTEESVQGLIADPKAAALIAACPL